MAEKDLFIYNDLEEEIRYLEPNQSNPKKLPKKHDTKVKLKHNENKMKFYALRINEHRRYIKIALEFGYTLKKYSGQLGSLDVIIWEVEFDIPERLDDDNAEKETKEKDAKEKRNKEPEPNVTVGDSPQ